jgi:hypothetical protein
MPKKSPSWIALTAATVFAGHALAQQVQEPLGGQPAAGSKPSVPDLQYQVKYQRALEAVVWSIPAVAIYRFRAAAFSDLGVNDNDIIAYERPATPRLEALTANNQTPYITAFTDLSKGPVVLVLPAATEKASLYGQIVDAWQVTIGDVGPAGLDKGKGGKYLLLPPGYDRPVPDGYLPVQSPNYRVAFAFRSVPGPKGTQKDATAYARTLQMYYLSAAQKPPKTRIVAPDNQRYATLPFYDERYFQDLYNIVSFEPVRPRDKVMMDYLRFIGIEKGKPFEPDDLTRKAMKTAVVDAYFFMDQLFVGNIASNKYWPDRHYFSLLQGDAKKEVDYEFPEMLDVDGRASQFFPGTYYPHRVVDRQPTIYFTTLNDATGKAFEAGRTYKLTMPRDVPVKQFWSIIVYDRATFAFIYNPTERAGLSSFDRDKMKLNPDGSVTIYMGPKAPAGLERNWIPTQGKQPLVIIRAYSPDEALYDKTYKLPDFEAG